MTDDKANARTDPPPVPKERDKLMDWPDRFGATRIPADDKLGADDVETDEQGKDDEKDGDSPS